MSPSANSSARLSAVGWDARSCPRAQSRPTVEASQALNPQCSDSKAQAESVAQPHREKRKNFGVLRKGDPRVDPSRPPLHNARRRHSPKAWKISCVHLSLWRRKHKPTRERARASILDSHLGPKHGAKISAPLIACASRTSKNRKPPNNDAVCAESTIWPASAVVPSVVPRSRIARSRYLKPPFEFFGPIPRP